MRYKSEEERLIEQLHKVAWHLTGDARTVVDAAVVALQEARIAKAKLRKQILKEEKVFRGRKFEILSLKAKVRYVQGLVRRIRFKRLTTARLRGFAVGSAVGVLLMLLIYLIFKLAS